jgi:phosphatidate cytidylyltransferase
MKRVITAVVLAPFITYAVLWGNHYLFLTVLTSIAMLCFWEFRSIVAGHGLEPPHLAAFAAGLVIMLAPLDVMLPTALALVFLALALRLDNLSKALPSAACAVLGLLYVFGTWRTAAELRAISPWWLFFALALNWFGDSAAYYTGRAFGKHKLAPQVSPGKTWEGTAGSLVASIVFGIVYAHYLLPDVSLPFAAAIAAAGNIAGQLGDLVESAMKRGGGLKDSGTLLPGHGGWLDRVDSSLFSVPTVYLLITHTVKQ